MQLRAQQFGEPVENPYDEYRDIWRELSHDGSASMTIRSATPGNLTDAYRIDLATGWEVWDQQFWDGIFGSSVMRVCLIDKKVVGFSVLHHSDRNPNDPLDGLELRKLGVSLKHRRLGVGSRLIADAVDFAKASKTADLFCLIPECFCFPNDPDSCIAFLRATGWAAQRERVPQLFPFYGEVEDGIVFCQHVLARDDVKK